MIEHFDLISEIPAPHYKMMRSFSTSNPSLQQPNRLPNGIPDGGIGALGSASAISSAPNPNNNVQVEYEVAMPVVQSFRHTPYHSLWNLNQWFVYSQLPSILKVFVSKVAHFPHSLFNYFEKFPKSGRFVQHSHYCEIHFASSLCDRVH